MVTLYSDKECEQIKVLLKEQVKNVNPLYFLLPVGLWSGLCADLPVGKIWNSTFWVVVPDVSVAARPYRFFFGKLTVINSKTTLTGSFRYHPYSYIVNLGLYVVVAYISAFSNIQQFIRFLALYPIFLITALLYGFLRGRRHEGKTTEFIERILTD